MLQAEKYQKSAGKKLIIIFLVIVVIAMIIGLIVYSKAKK
jgi:CHASE3 domain sensor protein